MKTYFVYILKCSDNSYYTGMTNNLDRRILEHKIGYDRTSYTFSRRPLKLVDYEAFQNPNDAIFWEKRIKGWTRKKKEALIKGDFDELVKLSNMRSRTSTSSV